MDSVEEKKWLIQRIDAVFSLHLDWIKQDKDQFQTLKQKEMDRYSQFGKEVIGAVAFIITVLLGLSTSGIKFDLVLGLGWIIAIGLWIYTIIAIFKVKNEKIFDKIQNSDHESISMIYYVMGYFHKTSMNLESLTPKDYDKFYVFFVYYVVPTLNLGEYQSLKKILNSKLNLMFLSIPAKKQLVERFQARKHSLDEAVARYEKEIDQYELDDFIEPILRFGDYLLEYKEGKNVVFSAS